jgi:hypothetical protein
MKSKRILTIIFTVLAVGMVAFSGVMKLSGNQEGAKMLEAFGVGRYSVLLGLAEIVFAALFAFPKTMRIGFLLLSCYFAGALATEFSHQAMPNALTPLVLVWIATLLRDVTIFIPVKKGAVLLPQAS